MNKDTLSFAGDISVEKLSIISTDGTEYSVINQLQAIQIFEDLYSPFITGTLVIKDSLDFVNALPALGQETLDIDMNTPSLKELGGRLKGQFCIYRIKNREIMGDRSVGYELDFISKEALVDWNTKISKSFGGRGSDVARQILQDEKTKFNGSKNIVIEETNNNVRFIANYWSPVKTMNYLAGNCTNEKGSSPSYLFFENRDGFNFVSMNLLVQSPTVTQNFNFNNTTRPISEAGAALRDVNMDYQRIENFTVSEGPNTMNRSMRGYMATTLITNDITTKKYEYKYWNALAGHYMTKHLNEFPLINWKFPISYDSKIMSEPKANYTFNSVKDATSTEIMQKRIYELNEKNDFKVSIVVPGRLDYSVGQVVKLNMFKMQPITATDELADLTDNIFSGKYLVGAINHFITREKHECTMELIKDSFIVDFSQSKTA